VVGANGCHLTKLSGAMNGTNPSWSPAGHQIAFAGAGTVISSLHRRHRAAEFKRFLVKIDKSVPGRPRGAPGVRQLRHPRDP